MASPYGCVHPYEQLRIVLDERGHIYSLAAVADMLLGAARAAEDAEKQLHDRKTSLLDNAWFDRAGVAFGDEVNTSLRTMSDMATVIADSAVADQVKDLITQYPVIYGRVETVCRELKTFLDRGEGISTPDLMAFCEKAARHTDELDRRYEAIAAAMAKIAAETPEWVGPRADLPAPEGVPGGPQAGSPSADPTSAGGAGGTGGAEVPAAATVPEAETPEVPAAATPDERQQGTDPASALASALQAAEGLLGDSAVPDALPAPDLGDLPVLPPFEPYDPTGQPALAGLDTGAFGGGLGGTGGAGSFGGGASVGGVSGIGGIGGALGTGPGTGGPLGAGGAPLAAGLARAAGVAGATSAGGMPMSPMAPPQAGAGGARTAGGIRPGNSDRPAAESRPRPRRAGPVTPGVALTGRAGAAAPKPVARRGWDSDNDSPRVLDEHLWSVHSLEEETHGQDRRSPGRDGRDRTTADRAREAGLLGPGGRADQPTRAR